MTLDLDKYAFTDGATPLSAAELNTRFYSLVRRLHALELLSIDWASAVTQVQNYGLARINDAVQPLVDSLKSDLTAVVAQGEAALASQSAAVEAKLAEVDATMAAIETRMAAVEVLVEAAAEHATRTDNPHTVTAAQSEAIPLAVMGAIGDLIVANGPESPVRLPLGAVGQSLIAGSGGMPIYGEPFVGGECRLDLSGGNLSLSRHNGYRVIIDNTVRTIPATGVTLAATSVANTTYYVYVYLAGGMILTLEASTTAHAVDPRNGVRIKNGDTSRSLIGMARTNASGAWVDSVAQRFVLSYYNRIEKFVLYFPTGTSTTSTTPVPLGTATYFLSWADMIPISAIVPVANSVSSGGYGTLGAAIDGGGTGGASAFGFPNINSLIPASSCYNFTVAEGYHYIEIKWSTYNGVIANNGGTLVASIKG